MANNINDSIQARLGSDMKFPINGKFETINGVNLLLQDIQLLLLTDPGERVMRPDIGAGLGNLVWENMDVAEQRGADFIRAAIANYEPRISLIDIDSTVNENTNLIVYTLKFIINNTDSVFNLVFPLRTGTDLSFA